MRVLASRFLGLFRRKHFDHAMDEEFQSHLEMLADRFASQGMTKSEALLAAKRQFGGVTQIEEELRERSSLAFLDSLWRDTRYALRQIRKSPAFAAVAVLTLALGIGANTAIFSVINAVLLRPLPYKDANRLAMLWSEDSAHGLFEGRVSLPNAADWKQRSHTFEDMTVFIPQTFLLGGITGPPERMRSARVSANFFRILGVEPLLGRAFTEEEEKRGEPVAVISYGLWRSHFGGNAQILGSDLIKDGRKSRIIGVMPALFHYPFDDTQVWEPRTTHPYWATRDRDSARTVSIWYALGRIRRGVTWEQAQAEMSVIGRDLQREYPDSHNLPEIDVVPLQALTIGRVQLPLLLLFGAVLFLLLIACSNVANLLLARGTARQAEFSLRRALGASRARLTGQLLTESLVLAIVGTIPGLAIAAFGVKALIAYGPRDIPRLGEARIDFHVLLFTLLLSVFAAGASGLWPALRSHAALSIRRQWNTAASRSVGNALAVAEVSITLVLLASAGLMLRSFVKLKSVNPGFVSENLLIMRIDLHVGRTDEQQVAYFREAIERAEAVPGVRSAAAISSFLRSDPENSVTIEGHLPMQPGPSYDYIEGPYFATAGIPLKQGRLFTNQDRRNSIPVAIINDTMSRTYWPRTSPLGKRFRFGERQTDPWVTVVGVVGDMHRQGLDKKITPQVFLPDAQGSEDMMDVIVRSDSDPLTIAAAVQNEIQSIDKTVPRFSVSTAEQQLSAETAERSFQTSLIGLFSVVALFLSIIGVYGLMHYFVQQRTNEIGVRMALGARYTNVLALVMRRGLTVTLVGIALGCVGALGVTQLLSSLLYGVSSKDPLTFVAAPVLLLAAAAVACWIPARRATRVDPMVALRYE